MQLIALIEEGNVLEAEAAWKQFHEKYLIKGMGNQNEGLCRQLVIFFEIQIYLWKKYYLEKGEISRSGCEQWESPASITDKLRTLAEEAVKCTVSQYRKKPLKTLRLSPFELNLILESIHWKWMQEISISGTKQIFDKAMREYKQLLRYVETAYFDMSTKVKIYPKAVKYRLDFIKEFSHKLTDGETFQLVKKNLLYTRRAIEMLRSTAHSYYLWELLINEGEMYQYKMCIQSQGIVGNKAVLKHYWQSMNWKQALEKLHKKYNVPVEMVDACYLAKENAVYCIPEVIKTRRSMLDMTRKQLCEEICTEMSLVRIENKYHDARKSIVTELFGRIWESRSSQQQTERTPSSKSDK